MSVEFDSVILAAGFGTRLGEFGQITPKGLITDGKGNTLISKIIDPLSKYKGRICLITNAKFEKDYEMWLNASPYSELVELLSDGVLTPESRKGAIGDLQMAKEHFKLSGNILAAPSDTSFEFEISDFIEFCSEKPDIFTVIVEEKESPDEIKGRLGCAVVVGDIIKEFVEKPENPPSPYGIIPFYYYPESHLPLIKEFIDSGGNPDAPSNIISWLIEKGIKVRAYIAKGKAIDVGTIEDVERLKAK